MEERIALKTVTSNEMTNKKNTTTNSIHNTRKNDDEMRNISDIIIKVATATNVTNKNNTNITTLKRMTIRRIIFLIRLLLLM